MTSEARIQANRRNAEKSTGPKTEAGKQIVRLNALTHGLAAETVVLPNEDAAAFEKRRVAWTRELSPGGDAGDYLAERAARISWQLDRADAAEHATLAKRVREVPKERERSRRRRAAEQVRAILAPDPDAPADRPKRTRAERLERLESTAHGCRALLEAWAALEGQLAGSTDGDPEVVGLRVVRLLGAAELHDGAHAANPTLRRVVDVLNEDRRRMFGPLLAKLKRPYTETGEGDPPLAPPDHTAATAALRDVIAEEQLRLMDLLEAREEAEPDLVAEDAARVAFDASKEAEAVHRYQNQWGRALLQTFKAIAALRPAVAAGSTTERVAEEAVGTASETEPTDPAVAAEQSQRDGDKANNGSELWQKPDERSRTGRGSVDGGRAGSNAVECGSKRHPEARVAGDRAAAFAPAA